VEVDAGGAGWLTIHKSDQGEREAISVEVPTEDLGQIRFREPRHVLSPLSEYPGSNGGEAGRAIG
jgi:hypothetical protein